MQAKWMKPLLALAALLCGVGPLHAQYRTAAPWAVADTVQRPELGGGHYAGMTAAGTLGSATGLLAGFLVAGAAYLVAGPDRDEGGLPTPVLVMMGAGSTLGTALAVSSIADPPRSMEFRAGAAEIMGKPVFRPALLGALLGIGSGAALGLLVDEVTPDDDPYALIAYGVGQAAASVIAVRLWVGADPAR